MDFKRDPSLHFSGYDGNTSFDISRVLSDEDYVDAKDLANFFSTVARGMGFDVSGVAIYFGESIHASDY